MQLLSVFIRVQFNNDTALIATIAEAYALEHGLCTKLRPIQYKWIHFMAALIFSWIMTTCGSISTES